MKTKIIYLLFLLIPLLSMADQTEEKVQQSPESATEQQSKEVGNKVQEAAKKETPPTNTTVKNQQEKSESFVPSEEISEDLVVSFPVDI